MTSSKTGSAVWEPYFLGLLADVYAQDGQVYAWFTEGIDTADLQAARALLDELA